MDKRPIGIFDSGLGGLTAVLAVRELMPEENIIYFADTARNPYGTRPVDELQRMAGENLHFLKQFGVKAIIAACGTMSANAGDVLRACDVPVVNVLSPAVAEMGRIGGEAPLAIAATEASIRSGAFTKRLGALCPGREVIGVACQDFVKLCESGHTAPGDPLLQEAVERYLHPVKAAGAAAMLLGCTHFGIISEAITAYLGAETVLVSASHCAAQALKTHLADAQLAGGDGQECFYTSGSTQEFEKLAEGILGYRVHALHGTAGE